jgi:hypothetical protein
MSTTNTVLTYWHFRCPECGVGDGELGHHATAEMIWCEICAEEQRQVRLKRWPVETDPAESSGSLPGGGGAPGPGLRRALFRR